MAMNTKVDMTYSILWDEEPTEEQLQVIMEEVAEEARRGHEELAKQIVQNIECEYRRAIVVQREQQ